jgi:nucleoside 2-deoxyribosyltransferase
MTQIIYLASPIDQGNTNALRDKAKHELLVAGAVVFDPSAGWVVSKIAQPTPALQHANTAVLRYCSGVLAILDPEILTVGVILEIQEAQAGGTPVVIYAPRLKPSWSLAYLGIEVHTDLYEAIELLIGEAHHV